MVYTFRLSSLSQFCTVKGTVKGKMSLKGQVEAGFFKESDKGRLSLKGQVNTSVLKGKLKADCPYRDSLSQAVLKEQSLFD